MYEGIEQKIKVHFTALELLLHQEALVSLMQFLQALQPPAKEKPLPEPPSGETTGALAKALMDKTQTDETLVEFKKRRGSWMVYAL